MSIYRAPAKSIDLQNKFKDRMLSLSEDQVYQSHDFGINESTLFSIDGNIAVYIVGGRIKVLNFEKMKLEQEQPIGKNIFK